jgi:hypothetical protein
VSGHIFKIGSRSERRGGSKKRKNGKRGKKDGPLLLSPLRFLLPMLFPLLRYGGLQMPVRDGKRYGTGSVSDLSIDHVVT